MNDEKKSCASCQYALVCDTRTESYEICAEYKPEDEQPIADESGWTGDDE
jgi:hypothetical protein